MNSLRITFLSLLLAVASNALGAPIVVPNGSFEDVNVAEGSPVSVPASWSVLYEFAATGGVIDSTDAFFPGTTGDDFSLPTPAHGGQFFASGKTAGGTVGRCTLTTNPFGTIAPETLYTVTIALGDALSGVFASYAASRHPNTILTLRSIDGLGGSMTLATANHSNSTYPPTASGTFTDFSFTYTSGDVTDPNVGRQFSLELRAAVGTGRELQVDNIRMDAVAVPEPSGAVLAAIGLGLLCQRRQRQRASPFRKRSAMSHSPNC